MTNTITIASLGRSMTAELYPSSGAPAKGVVVVAYGSDGLTDNLSGRWATMIRGYADSLAEKGFTALIPHYLAVTDTLPGRGVFDVMMRHREHWQTALSDAVDHAATLAKVDAGRVGLLGFSLGGHLCLRLRAKVGVLVEFFAPQLDGIGPPAALAHAQIHHGKADVVPGTGFANAEAIAATLKREGTATELFAYPGAGHGFIGDDQAAKSARELSKARTLAFFQAHLGQRGAK